MLELSYNKGVREAGCDEAGRGCLAGPVFAAAVILPDDFCCPELNDSKKMTAAARLRVRDTILAKALAWAVGEVSAEEIDRINILNASFEAMQRAVERLGIRPDTLLIDGNRFRSRLDIPFHCEVKADGRFADVAAASVLAKTFRDERMAMLDAEYPAYGWARNMGYPTREHRLAIMRNGVTPHHRLTFNHEIDQLALF